MKLRFLALCLAGLLGACAPHGGGMHHPEQTAKKTHSAHWSYSGESGPAHWGEMKAEFAACKNGQSQSPINITETATADLPKIQPGYAEVALKMVNNGHTIKLDTTGAGSAQIGENQFELLQFHFHLPSEEQINGEHYDLVAHMVHKNQSGQLGVIAVLFKVGEENAFLKNFWAQLPQEPGHMAEDMNLKLDPEKLLPSDLGYYAYMGSLTTPPCSEGVHWHVLKTPVEFSAEQKAAFAALYEGNNRPVQPLNGRKVQASQP